VNRGTREGWLVGNGSIEGHVREQDILAAVSAMQKQHDLLLPKAKDTRTVGEKLVDVLGARVARGIEAGVSRQATITLNMLQQFGVNADDIKEAARRITRDTDVLALANGDEVK